METLCGRNEQLQINTANFCWSEIKVIYQSRAKNSLWLIDKVKLPLVGPRRTSTFSIWCYNCSHHQRKSSVWSCARIGGRHWRNYKFIPITRAKYFIKCFVPIYLDIITSVAVVGEEGSLHRMKQAPVVFPLCVLSQNPATSQDEVGEWPCSHWW